MSFQILDANKQPILISELDKQAAEFWCKEVHPKRYASPPNSTNWFDCIGHIITYPKTDGSTGWKNVRRSLWILHTEDLPDSGVNFMSNLTGAYWYLLPYFSLIAYWEQLGYEPKKVL